MASRNFFSYWLLPVISGLTWLGMLLGMLLSWIIDKHSRPYSNMKDHKIAYISDIGASDLQPLFIAGCCVTAVFLDLSFISERWLRHRGRLVPNSSIGEKILAGLSIGFAFVGTAGLILLSIFNDRDYDMLHNIFLFLFIAGYMLSAIFICWEYQRLGIKNREHRLLRYSFWVKLIFVLVELALVICFAALSWNHHKNQAAVFEWTISLIFTFYALSFVIDLWPAVRTRDPNARFPKPVARNSEEASSDALDPHLSHQPDVEMTHPRYRNF